MADKDERMICLGVPSDLYKKIKIKAIKCDITIKEFAIEAFTEKLEKM